MAPEPKLNQRVYLVRWKSLYTDFCGQIGPMTKALAEAIVERNRRLFPDAIHWVELISAADLEGSNEGDSK